VDVSGAASYTWIGSDGTGDVRPRLMHGRVLRLALAVLAVVSLAAGAATSQGSEAPHPASAAPGLSTPAPRDVTTQAGRPNIVFILTDDLSMNLLRYMPHVLAMQRDGLTFNNYFVSDSLCCPSRSSIFTGNFPHDTKVFNNVGRRGGFRQFYDRGEEQHTFAVALQNAGYRTALMGKYLNGYGEERGSVPGLPFTYVPPGWSEWNVAGWGYPEFNYSLNENGQVYPFGRQPSDYLTDVLARKGVDFINSSAATGQPFLLELSTFAPHSPFTPAPRNANDFPGLRVPRPPNFNRLPADPPQWLAHRPPLTTADVQRIDSVFQRRAQSVQAVDQMIGRIETALAANGLSNNTYLVFSSDNGLHTGEYRLLPGKMTAFDTDIHVPLVISGPGVPAGTTTNAMSENVDLAKTFTQIGGTNLAGDGHSLVGLFGGVTPADWRDAILVEHRGPHLSPSDPDFQQAASGNPTSYEAMRTNRFLYVEYSDGEREIYNLFSDPFELHNLAGGLTLLQLEELHAQLINLERCHDAASCWAAMHVEAPPGLARSLRRARRPANALRRGHRGGGGVSVAPSVAYVA
jgi:N-acetylglucosamine-6-sulfatase